MTAIEHDWRRTHAVLVAVERYNGSDRLNLDGPVRDAIGMREWLTGRGVPPENIRLLASPMERNRAALEAAHPGYRPAERADVRKVFREGLSHIDGDDWLWVYWAGHGVQTRGGRWSLLYPETSDTDLQGLDADSLVDLVRTDHLRWDAVERVTVVIDACRQALPPAPTSWPTSRSRSPTGPRPSPSGRSTGCGPARPGPSPWSGTAPGASPPYCCGSSKRRVRPGRRSTWTGSGRACGTSSPG
ncbi:caspase family protein [Streptomyces malaysiensis subsp. malaysiensis]